MTSDDLNRLIRVAQRVGHHDRQLLDVAERLLDLEDRLQRVEQRVADLLRATDGGARDPFAS
jgi:hypothetical protein